MLTYGGVDSAVHLSGRRVSPQMRQRIANHPDAAIRDAYPAFVRDTVARRLSLTLDDLVEVYGKLPVELAADPDPHLRAVIAQVWRKRPMTVQAALLTDPDPAVRHEAVGSGGPGVPAELVDQCLADPAVRARLARDLMLTPEQFARLMEVGDVKVLRALAENPHLSADMVEQLQDSADPCVRVAVAFSRHVTAEVRERLLALVKAERAAGDQDARYALDWFEPPLWLRELPLGERLAYLDCPHPVFREALASCSDLPEEAWQRLDDDPDLSVRWTAARRLDAPPQVLERLVRSHGEAFRCWPLVEHPNFPHQVLRSFVDEVNPKVRVLALEDPELPVECLWRLADSEEGFLRWGVAKHFGVSSDLLERLMADGEPEVAEAAAANPVLTREQMEKVLSDAGL